MEGPEYACYKFGFEPTTWGEARADCLSTEGADLLVINSPAELAYINETGSAFGPWWIGKIVFFYHLISIYFILFFKINNNIHLYGDFQTH